MVMRGAELQTSPATGGRVGGWKKGSVCVCVRPWLMLYSSGGETEMKETGKTIMRRTGLPARDLRILDPLLSNPSTILGREKAIVINLEHIKAIITAQEVLLLNYEDPSVSPFITMLKRRVRCHCQATKPQEEENSEGAYARIEAGTSQPFGDQGSQAKKDAKQNQDGSKNLPFEFVALEACLESACSSLEHEALRLELEAHPAMEKLTSKISTLNLERVRQFKSRLVAITARVRKVRDALEHLLDDDEDMAQMYLTEKLAHKLEHSSTSRSDTVEVDLDDRLPPESASEDNKVESYLQAKSCGTSPTSSTGNAMRNKFDVKQLEMILEAYFVQIDGSLNKLSTLMEYVDGTEQLINIMLDDTQNKLLQLGVKLATINLVMGAFIAVAGVFGMNITIELFTDDKAGPRKFLWTVIGGSLGSVFLYFSAIRLFKFKRWLD